MVNKWKIISRKSVNGQIEHEYSWKVNYSRGDPVMMRPDSTDPLVGDIRRNHEELLKEEYIDKIVTYVKGNR